MPRKLSTLFGIALRRAGGADATPLARRIELKRNITRLGAALTVALIGWGHGALADEGAGQPSPADPFAAAAALTKDSAAKVPGSSNPFRASGDVRSAPAAASNRPAIGVDPAAKAQSDQALLDARRALSVGDLPRAQQFLGKAQQLKAPYQGPGDSPQGVAESIREYQELAAMRGSRGGPAWRQGYAKFLVKQADALLSWNDLESAGRAANEAAQLHPQFAGGTMTPQDVLRRIEERRKGQAGVAKPQAAGSAPGAADSESTVQLAGATMPSTSTPAADDYMKAAASPDAGAAMRLAQQPDYAPLPLPGAEEAAALPTEAARMLEAGEASLRSGDREGALQSFKAAYEHRDQLDLLSQQKLQGHMQMLSTGDGQEKLPSPDGELLHSAATGQTVVARQLSADVARRQSEAAKVRERDPNQSLKLLAEARSLVEESELSAGLKNQLLRRIDMSVADTEQYIEDHKSELELDEANRAVLEEIDRERTVKVEVQQRTAELVDQFNKLCDEQRFAEAEVVANRLYEMAPDELVAQQINKQAKMIRRERMSRDINELSEDGVAGVFLDTRLKAAEALEQSNSDISYDQQTWDQIANRKSLTEIGANRSLKELEIEQKLKTPVLPKYDEVPLTKVIEGLSQVAGVNIHLDPRGLEQEGVPSDVQVTLNLPHEIQLKSALTLILEPLHLTYSIKDEVLKITSEQIRDGDLKRVVYPVGDLVVPIPNFVPTNNMGLQGLVNDAFAAMGAYGPAGGAPGPLAMVAGTQPGQNGGPLSANVNAQQFGAGPQAGGSAPVTSGPGSLGGAAAADFDTLIDLIVSTVEHESWMENGTGEGDIQPFPTNLSLVISQTQRVHEQIADLLEQLRRLQDLQVTIEVRFIRLTDQFFERIGVDFDFDIDDRSGFASFAQVGPASQFSPTGAFPPPNLSTSATVGLQGTTGTDANPNFSVDLDLPFRQNSFGLAAPQFGTPVDVGNFGFAILSDIEAYFVIQAAQGDRRANILQAPKVTLFNGQQAIVVDAAQRPFVISVIPVVGEFAAAQQPVIVVLSEGTMMTVQAVISDDRRYVRMTIVPFFSQIGDVQEFTFEGTETTSSSGSSTDDDDDGNDETNEEAEEVTRSGTTVQLPTFEIITVATTVSVPDGGTVLLGGIKRLSEGRNEFGVPLLSKIPYVDRLFRNVGIGRDTDSLMMMVTPHIIIQEEEEERLGVAAE
jgi:general secretion pathway protein D